ncbi:MAG: BON domain-containing protein, partial [Chloroflexi bacterium]
MLSTQTTQANLAEISRARCRDRSKPSVDKGKAHRKSDNVDSSITERIDRALWNDRVLRSTDYWKIDVAVKAGIVSLSGNVMSITNQQRTVDAVRSVPGVQEIISHLVSDDHLIRNVACALGEIEHSYGVKFFTGATNGVVVVTGEVSSTHIRILAEKCAASIPGVRGVINAVRSPGIDLQAEDQRFLQPSIGEQIYYRDGPSVTVKKVIINPNNLRVTAMVVLGQYSNSRQDPRFIMYGEAHTSERLIVIPMSAVRSLTKSSGFLKVDSTEGVSYSDFNISDFVAPGEDWTPPDPYCPDDVLFPVKFVESMNQTENAQSLKQLEMIENSQRENAKIVITEHGIR